MGASHGVYRAFGVAVLTGVGAQRVGAFLHQQGLVAIQRIKAFEPALKVFKELRAGQLHGAILRPEFFRERAPKKAGA
jgi:hypothetical protein